MVRALRVAVALAVALAAGAGLAAPAAASPTLDPIAIPVHVGDDLLVTGSGCTPETEVTARAWATSRPTIVTETVTATADASGGFAVTVRISAVGSHEFVPGEHVGIKVECLSGGDGVAAGMQYVALAPLRVTIAVPAAHVFGTAGTVTVAVSPGMAGELDVTASGLALEEVERYHLGEAVYRVPAALPAGSHELVATFTPDEPSVAPVSATETLTVRRAPSAVTVSASSWRYGSTPAKATARVSSPHPGVVRFTLAGRKVGEVRVKDGRASLRLPRRTIGSYALKASFVPDDPANVSGSSASRTVKVTKARSTATVKASKRSVRAGSKVALRIRVSVTGVAAPTGRVRVYDGSRRVTTVRLVSADKGTRVVRLALRKGTHKLKVRYLGNAKIKADSSPRTTVTVR